MARWEERMNQWLASAIRDPGNPGALPFLQKLLRASETQPLEAVEVSARALYTTFFEAGRGESAAFVRRLLQVTTKAQREDQFALIAALSQLYGGESAEEALRLVRERHQATVLGTDLTTDEEVLLPHSPRPHVVMVGNTGSGKSTLLKHMIADTVSRGLGVAVIDPHDGALVNDVLGLIPERRLRDVVYLDFTFTDAAAAVGLNLFAVEDPGNVTQASLVASFVMHLFETLFFSSTGLASAPQFSQVMRNISRVMIEQSLSMAEIPLLLTEDAVRERLTATLRSPQVKRFFEEYNQKTPRERRELTASTTNKIDAYLSDPLISNIVSQRQTIPWRRLMDERALILISLSRQHEASRLIAATIFGQLLNASFSRMGMGEASCPEFHVYADEWHSMVTSDVATWIFEARKGRCVLHLANQSLSQLSRDNQQAALSAGALVAFRVAAADDSRTLAASFDHTPAPEIRAPVSDVVGHLLRRGHSHAAVDAFITDYLRPLEAVIRTPGGSQHESPGFALGCTVIHTSHLIAGQNLVNDVLVQAMRTGRGDGFIPPLALLILGGCADPRSTYVLHNHIKAKVLNGYVVEGFSERANAFGRGGFLANEQEALARLKQEAKTSFWDFLNPDRVVVVQRAAAFLRMLRSFRAVMEILATQPILVDTGEHPQRYKPHSYADAAAEVANSLARMENYTCRVKLLSGEHVIRTHPAPQGVSGEALTARLQAVKERMFERGLCRDVWDVEKEVAERHEALRGPGEGRPRRRRDAEPPPPAYG
jgi:hypothetical protein